MSSQSNKATNLTPNNPILHGFLVTYIAFFDSLSNSSFQNL